MAKNYKNYWEKVILVKLAKVYQTNKHILISENLINKFNIAHEELISKKKILDDLMGSKKNIRKNKIKLEQTKLKYKIAEVNKLLIHQEIINKLELFHFMNFFDEVIPYKHMGPLPNGLIKEVSKISDSYCVDSIVSNPFTTSWGIFDNKIIIHKARQIMKRKFFNDEQCVFLEINSYRYSSCLMLKNHEELEFSFNSNSDNKSSQDFNKENNYNPMDNELFEENYNWIRNNEVQFRMIFTPLVQEKFLIENNYKWTIKPWYAWKKVNNFFLSDYDNQHFNFTKHNIFLNTLKNFSINPEISIHEFKKSIFFDILNYYNEIYKSLNFLWLIPIFNYEDHSEIIKKICNEKSRISTNNIAIYAHYILNVFFPSFTPNIDKKKYTNFKEIKEIQNIVLVENKKIYKLLMKEIIYETASSGQYNNHNTFYIEKNEEFLLYICDLHTEYYFINIDSLNIYTNITNVEVLEFIKKVNKKCLIRIEFGILSLIMRNEISNIDNEIQMIIKYINNLH